MKIALKIKIFENRIPRPPIIPQNQIKILLREKTPLNAYTKNFTIALLEIQALYNNI